MPEVFEDGEKICFLGNTYILSITNDTPPGISFYDNRLIIALKDSLSYSKDLSFVFDSLRNDFAFSFFTKRLKKAADAICPGFLPDIKTRKMKARFGTCYPDKKLIILNVYIIHIDIACIDYVIAHELIHFKISDHSRAFYSQLSVHIPDWKVYRDRLKKFSPYLRELSK